MADGDGSKTVYIQYCDVTANISGNFTATIILDTLAPTGSFIIEGGSGYTDSAYVNLVISATDAGSGADMMRFSNDEINWSAWEPYAPAKAWILTSRDGIKTVYVQFSDVIGNISDNFSDSIILDTIAPIGSIIINGGANSTYSIIASLTVSAVDSSSGVDQMHFSNNGSSWQAWEPYASEKVWMLTSVSGVKTVYVQYRDVAGNSSVSFTDTITYVSKGNQVFLPFVGE